MAEPVRFYIDEQSDKAIARALRQHGADVVRGVDIGLEGADDDIHLEVAVEQQRAIITRDRDFLRLAAEGNPHWGILYAQQHTGLKRVIRSVLAIHEQRTAEQLRNTVVYL